MSDKRIQFNGRAQRIQQHTIELIQQEKQFNRHLPPGEYDMVMVDEYHFIVTGEYGKAKH